MGRVGASTGVVTWNLPVAAAAAPGRSVVRGTPFPTQIETWISKGRIGNIGKGGNKKRPSPRVFYVQSVFIPVVPQGTTGFYFLSAINS